MKTTTIKTKPLVLRPLISSLFLALIVLFLIFFLQPNYQKPTTNNQNPSQDHHLTRKSFSEDNFNGDGSDNDLRIRPGFKTYDEYIKRQLDKTLNPKLRKVWVTRDWDRKINVFSKFFSSLRSEKLLSNDSKALCIGARVGQEVAALKRIGVADSVGIDLVPHPPLVLKGDFHAQPFDNNTFDFEFSNVFDHALYPSKFVGEIERTLKPGGVCVLHVALSRRADKYSANDLFSVGPLMQMFRESEVVHVRSVDGFGLDTEVVFRKKINNQRL